MKYDMNKEIKKYKVFYVHAGQLEETFFVENIGCYDHYTVQLHHFVPYTDWEKNTRNVREKTDQKLILMPIAMHQHLENPVYKLDKESFKKLYGIHPNELLFDVNSHDEEMQKPWKDTEMFEGLETDFWQGGAERTRQLESDVTPTTTQIIQDDWGKEIA